MERVINYVDCFFVFRTELRSIDVSISIKFTDMNIIRELYANILFGK